MKKFFTTETSNSLKKEDNLSENLSNKHNLLSNSNNSSTKLKDSDKVIQDRQFDSSAIVKESKEVKENFDLKSESTDKNSTYSEELYKYTKVNDGTNTFIRKLSPFKIKMAFEYYLDQIETIPVKERIMNWFTKQSDNNFTGEMSSNPNINKIEKKSSSNTEKNLSPIDYVLELKECEGANIFEMDGEE